MRLFLVGLLGDFAMAFGRGGRAAADGTSDWL